MSANDVLFGALFNNTIFDQLLDYLPVPRGSCWTLPFIERYVSKEIGHTKAGHDVLMGIRNRKKVIIEIFGFYKSTSLK